MGMGWDLVCVKSHLLCNKREIMNEMIPFMGWPFSVFFFVKIRRAVLKILNVVITDTEISFEFHLI